MDKSAVQSPQPATGRRQSNPREAIAPLRIPPRRVPAVGQVLDLANGDVRYRPGPLRLQVTLVRLDISQWYGGEWVWVEGHVLDRTGHPVAWQEALIRVAALDDDVELRPVGSVVAR